MTTDSRSRWLLVTVLGITTGLASLLRVAAQSADSDGDGLTDEYEEAFGLDPWNAADAANDSDQDGLSNWCEARMGTDPLGPAGLWDVMAVRDWGLAGERVIVPWGRGDGVDGEEFNAEGPDWWLGGFKDGGWWVTNVPMWYVPAEVPEGEGALYLGVDRQRQPNAMVLEVLLFEFPDSSLYVDLTDTNGCDVATNLVGDLVADSRQRARLWVGIPSSRQADAAWIRLRRGSGRVAVLESALFPVTREVLVEGTYTRAGASALLEGETDPSGAAFAWQSGSTAEEQEGTNGVGTAEPGEADDEDSSAAAVIQKRIIYVDAALGDDTYTGLALVADGIGAGPKRTVGAALRMAQAGDTVSVGEGTYMEDVRPGAGVTLTCRGHAKFR